MNNKKRRAELARKSKIALIIMAITTVIICIIAIVLFKISLIVLAFFMCTLIGFAVGKEEMIDLYESWLEEEDKIEDKNV